MANYYRTFLTSVDYIKTVTSLSDNVDEKVIFPCLKMAQNVELQVTIGTCLFRKLQELVWDGTISDPGNESYKFLIDNFVQDCLAYWTLARLVHELSFKLSNLGTIISNDEHVVSLNQGERDILYQSYMNNASTLKMALQDYLRQNRELFPELDCCLCGDIKPNLTSHEDVGIWLGGIVGKRLR